MVFDAPQSKLIVKKPKSIGNPKAFTFRSSKRAARSQTRILDVATKRHHVPNDRYDGDIKPPIIVVVVGPPRVGKSTLISSLVKRYNRQQISNIRGPITVVSGKNQRITFIECNNDIN
ncbi:hypothetical protein MXB_4211 [Myxobolus squamalis]|nr:hypothetical protein MXB_4211 [Myxobolus squamalis]